MAFELGSFLIQFLVVVGGAALFRRMAGRVHQPPVIGEIALGMLLGASILGVLSPQAFSIFFPQENRPLMEALGWIGLILFIYGVGARLEWDAREAWPIFFIAMGGLIVPFVTGAAIGLAAPSWFFPAQFGFQHMLLLACIMSVSAIAVLGRLLADLDMLKSRAATLSMGAATIQDIVAWILVALVAGSGTIGLVGDLSLNLVICAGVFVLALVADRTAAPYFVRQAGKSNPTLFVVLLFSLFAAALFTHEAGLHALLGALAVGGVISRHPALRDYASTRLNEMTNALFLPAFFVVMGMDVDLRSMASTGALGALALLVLLASVSKIVGVYVGGRAMNVDAYTTLEVGILLNNRGAVDLVIAKIGYDAGLLSANGFSLLVIMITLTTLLSPISLGLLKRFSGRHRASPTPAASPQDLEA